MSTNHFQRHNEFSFGDFIFEKTENNYSLNKHFLKRISHNIVRAFILFFLQTEH